MLNVPSTALAARLARLDPQDEQYATQFVDLILAAAQEQGASDIHLQPAADGLKVRLRLDGVLVDAGTFPQGAGSNIVARLKVLSELLTYRNDVPQEGRIRTPDQSLEMRVSTFPTIYGEKGVVRLFQTRSRFGSLDDLGLPADVQDDLRTMLSETSGGILVTGPAGSGKTTTLYACLHELVAASGDGRNIVTLEDPVEVAISGIAQSQVNPTAGFGMASGLRSLVRQDPEVIMVGEIRDRDTAEIALQAALTGQLLLTSFHAADVVGAIGRLLDMGIEPYVLNSSILAIVSQRLLRELCDCAKATRDPDALLGLPVDEARVPVGCEQCGSIGYRGRFVLAEHLRLDRPEVHKAILTRPDSATLRRLAAQAGMASLFERALAAVRAGRTSPGEVRRVFGFGPVALDNGLGA